MSLYHKYRPEEFDEIVGNQDVVDYLKEVLQDLETCPHVFLLHGPTGSGKTTLARIITKELGCDPVDLKEINSANFRGIDTVREIINSSRYHSIGGGTRVYIIDECHQITRPAQEALLKLLEDGPDHAYFILCTTEPNKLIPTIRSRCIELQVSPLNEIQMHKLLKRTVKAEGSKLGKEIYEQIIQDSFGLPRNALQVLDRVLKVDPDRQLELAKQSIAEKGDSIELCRVLSDQKNPPSWRKVSRILRELKDQEAESIRRHVLKYCQSMLLKGVENDKAAFIIEEFSEPFYDIGFPGLILSCYTVVKG